MKKKDENVKLKTMNSDPFGQKQLWVPIKIIEKEKKKTRNAEVPIVLNDSNFY